MTEHKNAEERANQVLDQILEAFIDRAEGRIPTPEVSKRCREAITAAITAAEREAIDRYKADLEKRGLCIVPKEGR